MSTEDLEMDETLTMTAMQIILHAGEARSAVRKVYRALAEGDRAGADRELETARGEIKQSHMAQTELIQAEARGEQHTMTLLFSHAQDSLMTINSEVITAGNLLAVFDSIEGRLAKLENQV